MANAPLSTTAFTPPDTAGNYFDTVNDKISLENAKSQRSLPAGKKRNRSPDDLGPEAKMSKGTNYKPLDSSGPTLCPPELRDYAEAARASAQENERNLTICSMMIHGVESVQCPGNWGAEFIDGLRQHLRNSVAEYLQGTYRPKTDGFVAPTAPRTQKASVPASVPASAPPPPPTTTPATPPKDDWATVAQKGKSRSKAKPGAPEVVDIRPSPTKGEKKKALKEQKSEDKRLFLRIPKGHKWSLLGPAGARDALIGQLACPPEAVAKIAPTPTGFAVTATAEGARQSLLDLAEKLPQGIKLEPASNWISFMIPSVPLGFNGLHGHNEVTAVKVSGELVRVTKKAPVKVRPLGAKNSKARVQSWVAHFETKDAPSVGFRLFDESGIATLWKPKPSLTQCKRCQDFHPTRGCSRAPSCANCGSTAHSEKDCAASPKCRNCSGPHHSTSTRCLVRPVGGEAPTMAQKAVLRAAGQREYQAAAKERAAREQAKAAEDTSVPTDSAASTSQIPAVPAGPAENGTQSTAPPAAVDSTNMDTEL